MTTARIALVGDRSLSVQAHVRVPSLLEALRERDGLTLDAYWIPTTEAEGLEGFDGIWTLPGSPYRSEAGAVNAIRTAREHGIPFLGTCGGFQHALLEYARNVLGLPVAHAENDPDADEFLVLPLACSLVGHEDEVRLAPGSLAEKIIGAERSMEKYLCGFGLNPRYVPVLEEGGLNFTGRDETGAVRALELPAHPFFLATLFQPELAGDGTRPHPIITAFASAAVAHAGSGAPGRAGVGPAAGGQPVGGGA
ncbi:CTP synthase C-terminal region-related (seleno)protein [Streptosporangium roseum]|uniref:CTP synthase (glutamine hydrolyzing) n=1 Tax=Streptosporangium roseum (strain ATCC 12428 / DSM 43021 / JCM 3005 / KCTC 9067 / NCIMB 10171 / NRRL 2505 / NI 9100) TaxID=479432 RepID=D2B1U2_STRRD|nr:CTP synthase [Streptosporangium roseum]ACZ87394.1 CTP synthase [Streptosporangium roseum DSM 43021]